MALFQFRDHSLPYSLYPSPTLLDVLIYLPREETISPSTWEQTFISSTSMGPKGRVCVMEAWPEPTAQGHRNDFLMEMLDTLGLIPQVLIVNQEGMAKIAADSAHLIAPLKGLVVVNPATVSWDEDLRAWRTQLRKECPILLIEKTAESGKSSAASKDFERQWTQVKSVFVEAKKMADVSAKVSQFLLDLD